MNCLQTWPEPIVRVQTLAESGIKRLPRRYIKPVSERPQSGTAANSATLLGGAAAAANIPVVSLKDLASSGGDEALRGAAMADIGRACREWGFFQVVDHGVCPGLMKRARATWREFFEQPVAAKQSYANSPATYEGYGSRLGVEKGALLDWSDYFFLNFMPVELRRPEKWPSLPSSCRYSPVYLCVEQDKISKNKKVNIMNFALFLSFSSLFGLSSNNIE